MGVCTPSSPVGERERERMWACAHPLHQSEREGGRKRKREREKDGRRERERKRKGDVE